MDIQEQLAIQSEEIARLSEQVLTQSKEINVLKNLVELLQKENGQLRLENVHLKERLGLNSQNSSLSPSSTFGKKGLKPLKSKKTRGGQNGHKGTSRTLLDESEVSEVKPVFARNDCICGQTMTFSPPVRHQYYELPALSLELVEVQLYHASCVCGQKNKAVWPKETLPGMLGPRLLSWCNVLTAKCNVSRQKVCELLTETFGLNISPGTLSNQEKYLSEALKYPVLQLQEWLKTQETLYVDETSWKESGRKHWVWTASGAQGTVFHIDPSRSKKGFESLLGNHYEGIVCSDRFRVYETLDTSKRAICWAHLVRDFQRIQERAGPSSNIGKALLKQAKFLFEYWHCFQQGEIEHSQWIEKMQPVKSSILRALKKGSRLTGEPKSSEQKTAGTCKEILKVEKALWTFLSHQVEPTNNQAERALRKIVLNRKIQYGSQSERGSRFVERVYSILETCQQQGRSAWLFCEQALRAHFGPLQYPSLLPTT
jgi:transposase